MGGDREIAGLARQSRARHVARGHAQGARLYALGNDSGEADPRDVNSADERAGRARKLRERRRFRPPDRLLQDLVLSVLYDSQIRLARTLLRLCRLGEARNGHDVLSFRLTHQTLAQMTGTTRSRVSLFMRRFQTLGLIRYDHGLLVDRARLAEFLRQAAQPAAGGHHSLPSPSEPL